MKKISRFLFVSVILLLIVLIITIFYNSMVAMKSSVVARDQGMILEYHTNITVRNPQSIGNLKYGDLVSIRAGDVVLKIGELNNDYIVMYYPRGYSIETRHNGLVFLWNKKDYDETIERQRSTRLAVSNALSQVHVRTERGTDW